MGRQHLQSPEALNHGAYADATRVLLPRLGGLPIAQRRSITVDIPSPFGRFIRAMVSSACLRVCRRIKGNTVRHREVPKPRLLPQL